MSELDDKMQPPSKTGDNKARCTWTYLRDKSTMRVDIPGKPYPALVSILGMGRRVYWRLEGVSGAGSKAVATYVLERYGQ